MFNKYPYTDYHELNLDWFITQFKELVSDWDTFKADLTAQWESLSTDWTTLYNYVHDYFNDLDVQAEIDSKLDEMVEDGTLLAVVEYSIVNTTNDWLTENITQPTTPVIDASLTISGAGADAAVVGNYFDKMKEYPTYKKGNYVVTLGEALTVIHSDVRLISELFEGPGDSWTITVDSGYRARVVRLSGDQLVSSVLWVESGSSETIPNSSYIAIVLTSENDDTLPDSFWDHVTVSFLPAILDGSLQDNSDNVQALMLALSSYPTYEPGNYVVSVGSALTEIASAVRLRTVIFPGIGTSWTITVDSGYRARVIRLTAAKVVASVLWVEAETATTISNSPYIAIVLASTNDDTMPDGFWDHLTVTLPETFDDDALTTVYDEISALKVNMQADENALSITKKFNLVATRKDSAWSWWMYPQVLYKDTYKQSAIFGEVSSAGLTGVAEIDLDNGQTVKANLYENNIDDHNCSAVLELADGRLLIGCTQHADERFVHLYRSSNPENITAFDDEIMIQYPSVVTYVQMFLLPDNTIVLFTRVDANTWYVCYSESADGSSWESPYKLIDSDMQYYAMFRPTTQSGWLNVAIYSNPNLTTHDTRIRCAKFDAVNRVLYDASNNVLASAGNYVTYTNVPIFVDITNYTSTGTLRNRLLDLAITAPGSYSVLYCRFNNATDGVYHAKLGSTDYTIISAGGCFYTASFYYGGAIFNPVDTSVIYLSRYSGNRYRLEKYTMSGTSYVLSETIDTSETDGLMYPVCRPIIDPTGSVLIYQKGRTSLTSFNQYSYDAEYIVL